MLWMILLNFTKQYFKKKRDFLSKEIKIVKEPNTIQRYSVYVKHVYEFIVQCSQWRKMNYLLICSYYLWNTIDNNNSIDNC